MVSTHTGIEWTDKTWNPTTGCDKVSPGCTHCYAEAITKRFPNNFPQGFKLTLHPERLEEPKRWRKPSRIFVNSMSDLFHKDVPLEFILKIFQTISETPHHTYQILTKRADRLVKLSPQLEWHKNIWMGVSVENQLAANKRIPPLLKIPAAVRFLSCEPLLEQLNLFHLINIDCPKCGGSGTLPVEGGGCACDRCFQKDIGGTGRIPGIHWVIVGGESGSQYRPMQPFWAQSIRDQCQDSGIAFFFKQIGGINPKAKGRLLDGKIWDEMPKIEKLEIQYS